MVLLITGDFLDYFKHYSTASDSKLINHLFDDFGHSGYAYWFLLLELCAENWDGKSDPSFKFHTRLVRRKLRITRVKLESFLGRCQVIAGLRFQFSGSELEIDIPKLAEVKASRSVIKSNKISKTVYIDIDKDIEIDTEQVVAEKSVLRLSNHFSSFDECQLPEKNLPEVLPKDFRNPKDLVKLDTIQNLFNETLAGKAGKIQHCRSLSGVSHADFANTTSYKEFQSFDTWVEIFEKVAASDFLKGLETGFVASLNWLLIHNNASKVLNGQYGGESGEAQTLEDDLHDYFTEFGGQPA